MRNILALLATFLLLAGCSSQEDHTVVSDNTLNDLKELTEVAEYFYENLSIEEKIVKKVEGMIYRKVIGVRTLQPQISKLNGASLEGLCAVVVLSRNPRFGKALGDGQLSQLAISYLKNIEPQLKERTNELKETIFTDNDCAI